MAKRRWLTPDIVIEKAAAMADEAKQFETVTLTAVAAALDVRVPSLYNHVANLEDLHHSMAVYGTQLLLADLRAATAGQTGRAALLAMAAAYRQFVQAHPGLYPLTIRAPEPDDPVLTALAQEMVQLLQWVLASFGLQGDDAIHAIRGLRAILHGFSTLEAAEGYKMPLVLDESFQRLINTYLDGLAP